MPRIEASASALIPAPAPIVYGIIADYEDGHPAILPPRFFQNLTVVEGGTGAGTRIAFQMRSWGTTRDLRARITEPEPGRRLVETFDDGTETAFTVAPEADGRSSRVTIATSYQRPGLRGRLEGFLAPRFLRSLYTAELRTLAAVASARTPRA
jgi:polyketide cyclase/dehydrase/lipid transport protein